MPVSTAGLVAIILFGLFMINWMATDDDGFLTLIDSFNLVVHEFGHPFFAIFGEWPQWWGGTWMQVLVPSVILGVFWFQRSALSVAFAGIWLAENFHYIAYYMADARAQVLPLAGGGEHDWTTILDHHGLLHRDTAIAAQVEKIAYIGVAGFMLFAFAVWLIQRQRRAAAPPSAAAQPQPHAAPPPQQLTSAPPPQQYEPPA